MRVKRLNLGRLPLIFLISAFVVLDLTLLFLNVRMTKKLEHDALIINVTGRQRMLSQNIAKDILIIYSNDLPKLGESYTSLQNNTHTFHQTLIALKQGGKLYTPEGQTIEFQPLHDQESLSIIDEVFAYWQATYDAVFQLNENSLNDSKPVLEQYIETHNELILKLMNDLTVRSEHLSNQTAFTLRLAQIFVFILVFIDFLLIVHQLQRVRANNRQFTQQLEILLQDMPHASLLVNARQEIVYANKKSESIFETTIEDLQHKKLSDYFSVSKPCSTMIFNGRHLQVAVSNALTIPKELKLVNLVDVSEAMELKEKIQKDELTQTFNRTGLAAAYKQLSEKHTSICCLFIDLDRFKEVNDRFGHKAGDRVLKIFTKRLTSCLKEQDVVARLGGDEFVILMATPPSTQAIENLCQRLKHTIAEDIWIDDCRYNLSFSIGVRIADTHTETLDTIVHDADKSMYQQKFQFRQAY
ncbi:diguanylate cyclase [Reinekea marinisedimentorum]|uniref:Diguanylate cyclase (GGDEF)-like protein n=1 Tax=Reinekea marinisedimentorum TaxID=230495 RepID=A0A4R3I001_9GAMM|nr:diguanylate cyclase [Reinekea marinisedimentorum]TCS38838.1 diguanylate cyclase (GGDEF)-like protein [Reinekea marinisedimentorum]